MLPSNPEIEFNNLWGNISTIGHRTDISICQSFNFPTSYVYLNQIANLKNELAEFEYQKKTQVNISASATAEHRTNISERPVY